MKDIKWGTLSDIAFKRWFDQFSKGNMSEGVPISFSIATSPDNSDYKTAFEVMKKGILSGEASFWRGSANFTFTKTGDNLYVELTDAYSISSGISRNSKDNLERIRNFVCPLSNTYIKMNFSYKLQDNERVY